MAMQREIITFVKKKKRKEKQSPRGGSGGGGVVADNQWIHPDELREDLNL